MALPELGTYVYLASLNDIDPDYANRAKAYSTFNIKQSKNNAGESIQPIQAAIAQLRNIAAVQNTKEHIAIKNYLAKINKYIEDESIPDILKQNLLKQRDKIGNLDFNSYKSDQLDLIQAINIVTQDINSYERRLKEISTPVKYSNEFQSRFEFNIQERVEHFFENSGKTTHGRNIDRDRYLSEIIDKKIATELKNFPPELINELKAIFFIDFNNWIENKSSNKKAYTQLEMEDIEPLFKEYSQLAQNELTETHFQRLVRSQSDKVHQLALDLKQMIHSTTISDKEYQYLAKKVDERSKNYNNNNSSSKIHFQGNDITLNQARALLKTYNYNLQQDDGRYAFTLHSRVSHGNFYEYISTILKNAINIEGNVAGDLILPIGTVTFSENEQHEQQELMNLSQNLSNILTEDFKQQQNLTIENFDNLVKAQQELSNNMQSQLNKSKKAINEINSLNETFFIAHESTKLYRGAEQQESDFEDFHGRNMRALNALTKLYASPVIANSMIDPQLLILYLINISEATLAVNQKPLEVYLSLFAGLLMFDDIRSLTESTIKQITSNLPTSNIECLHVYNIGGIYYPISVFLNELIIQMDSIVNNLSIDSSRTASAIITGPTPSAPKNTDLNSWKQLANETIQNTSIQIHFLTGFSEYISALFANFYK